MDNILVVLFDSKRQAYEGYWALKALHAEGNLTLYDAALVSKGSSGQVFVKQSSNPDPTPMVERAVAGSVVGLLGPVGTLVSAEVLGRVASRLEPGQAAVVAEVQEELETVTDSRLAAVGGRVSRRAAAVAVDDQIKRDFASIETNVASPEPTTGVARDWWALVVRGVAAALIGVAAFVSPGITLSAVMLLFGAYALAEGVLGLVYAFDSKGKSRWLFAVEGLVGIGVGIAAFAWPGITELALLYLVAGWAICFGLVEIANAVWLGEVIENEWLLGLGGLLSLVLGVALVATAGSGALAMIRVIGAYALLFGVLEIALGLRLRSLDKSSSRPAAA